MPPDSLPEQPTNKPPEKQRPASIDLFIETAIARFNLTTRQRRFPKFGSARLLP
jgi:hypothetical protein